MDSKLHVRIIEHCRRLASAEGLVLRRSYRRTVKALRWQLRGGTSKQANQRARRAQRRLKTIARCLVRELERKLPAGAHADKLAIYRHVLAQQRSDKEKIYSLHEPHVRCFAKGKTHKKYEFGNKVALVVGAQSGVIVAAESFTQNLYDARTLPAVLDQAEANTGARASVALADRGFRGAREVGGTEIVMPQAAPWPADKAGRRRRRQQNARRVSIEPRIGHLKSDFRLGRNFLRGVLGDALNVMLAAAASNLRKWMRELSIFVLTLLRLIRALLAPLRQSFAS